MSIQDATGHPRIVAGRNSHRAMLARARLSERASLERSTRTLSGTRRPFLSIRTRYETLPEKELSNSTDFVTSATTNPRSVSARTYEAESDWQGTGLDADGRQQDAVIIAMNGRRSEDANKSVGAFAA